MSSTLQQKWNALREKRSHYPKFRQILLWVRDVGLIVDAALCAGLALAAPPTVLTDHPWLQAYVDFIGRYFVAAHQLSVGALHPQVSQLVFALGWGIAIVPFVASLLHTLIYILLLDYRNTWIEVASKYDARLKRPDLLVRLGEYLAGPFMISLVAAFILGDLGIIHFGWINGYSMTKAECLNQPGLITSLVFIHLYTSRTGLGIIAPFIIYIGVMLYSGLFLAFIFLLFPIWLSRMRRRLTWRHDE